MNTLTTHEIRSVSGGDFPLYSDPFIPERVLPELPPPFTLRSDPFIPERVLPAPASPVGIRVPPERWPICPLQPEAPSAY